MLWNSYSFNSQQPFFNHGHEWPQIYTGRICEKGMQHSIGKTGKEGQGRNDLGKCLYTFQVRLNSRMNIPPHSNIKNIYDLFIYSVGYILYICPVICKLFFVESVFITKSFFFPFSLHWKNPAVFPSREKPSFPLKSPLLLLRTVLMLLVAKCVCGVSHTKQSVTSAGCPII